MVTHPKSHSLLFPALDYRRTAWSQTSGHEIRLWKSSSSIQTDSNPAVWQRCYTSWILRADHSTRGAGQYFLLALQHTTDGDHREAEDFTPHDAFAFYFRSLQLKLNENHFNASHKTKSQRRSAVNKEVWRPQTKAEGAHPLRSLRHGHC